MFVLESVSVTNDKLDILCTFVLFFYCWLSNQIERAFYSNKGSNICQVNPPQQSFGPFYFFIVDKRAFSVHME